MKVQALPNTSIYQLFTITRSASSGRKLAMPVEGRLLLYSRFKHVHGTPSIQDGDGLSLSRLRAMDNLIDRLIALRGKDIYRADVGGFDRVDLEFFVDKLQKELNTLVSGEKLPLTAGSEQNDLGLLLDLTA